MQIFVDKSTNSSGVIFDKTTNLLITHTYLSSSITLNYPSSRYI